MNDEISFQCACQYVHVDDQRGRPEAPAGDGEGWGADQVGGDKVAPADGAVPALDPGERLLHEEVVLPPEEERALRGSVRRHVREAVGSSWGGVGWGRMLTLTSLLWAVCIRG
eukprot:COSAG04_NODE_1760_length_5665_cov_4.392203_5_plen_113_part_00